MSIKRDDMLLNQDFINKLKILHDVLNLNINNNQFTRKKNYDELNFDSFSLNIDRKFAGRYYENQKRNFTIWLGYYNDYDFVISFWTDNSNIKNQLLNILEKNEYDCLCTYSGITDSSGNIEKYWISVQLFSEQVKENFENYKIFLQEKVDKIINLVTSDDKINEYINL